MKRRRTLLVAAVGIMVAIAALGQQKAAPKLLVLEWAGKAAEKAPPVAVLVEMGLKDAQPKNWSGKAVIAGAKIVGREGYRFRDGDKLTGDGWEASSHKPLRGAGQMPKNVQILMEPTATVGVVYHLADVQADATLTLSVKDQDIDNVKVPLKDVLAGKTQAVAEGRLAVRLISTAVPVYTGPTEDDFPAACYGPDGTLWLAWIAYHVKDDSRRIEPPQLKEQPKDFKDYFTPEFGDQLLVKYFRNGKWSNPIAVTNNRQDLLRCAIAAEGDGSVWVVYSANRQGKFNLYGTPIRPTHKADDKDNPTPKVGAEQQLTKRDLPSLHPAACVDQAGRACVLYQLWREDGSHMISSLDHRKDEWAASVHEFAYGGKGWHPAIAAGPDGSIAQAYDTYGAGDSDIYLTTETAKETLSNQPIITTSRYEARPSICYDPAGRLWVAYEEGPEQWGKNYGPFDERGNPLYFARTVKVVCLENGKLMRPIAELPPLPPKVPAPDTGQKAEALPRLAYPKIGIDGKGRVWLTYRVKFGTRYTTHPASEVRARQAHAWHRVGTRHISTVARGRLPASTTVSSTGASCPCA